MTTKTKLSKQLKNFKIDFQSFPIRIIIFVVLTLLLVPIMRFNHEPIIKFINDSNLEFSRVLSLENIFQSPVNFKLFNHSGQMINTFYPWIFVYPMYWLIILCQNVVTGYYVYFIILTVISLEVSYRCIFKISKSFSTSLFFSMLFNFAIYRMLDIYYRIDIGEAITFTFLPVLLLGLYQLFYEEKHNYMYITIGMTGILYSRLSSFFVALVLVIILFIINLFRKNVNKVVLINFAKASGLTILLGLGYLVPLIQNLIKQPINFNNHFILKDGTVSLSSLIFNSINNIFGDADMTPGIGIILVVALGLIIFNINKYHKWEKDLILTMFITLFMVTTLFPWFVLQDMLSLINFPWRLLCVVSLLIAYLGARALTFMGEKINYKTIFVVLSVILIGLQISTLTTFFKQDTLYKGASSPTYQTNKQYLELYDERFDSLDFIPTKLLDDPLAHKEVIVNGKIKDNISPNISNNGTELTYNIHSNKKGSVLLPIYQYEGLKVIYNGKNIELTDKNLSNKGYLKLPVNKGNNKYIISYQYTLIAKVSCVISVVTLVTIIVYSVKRKKDTKC